MVTEHRKPTANNLVIVESWTTEKYPQLVSIDIVEHISGTNRFKIHLSTPELIRFYNELGQTILDLEVQAQLKKKMEITSCQKDCKK